VNLVAGKVGVERILSFVLEEGKVWTYWTIIGPMSS